MTTSAPGAPWPLVLVVFGPFAPERDAARLDADAVFPVDKDTLDDVLRHMVGELSLRIVPGPRGEAEQWVTIPVTRLRSFHPDAIVQAVPELRSLAQLRRSIADGECPPAVALDRLREFGAPVLALDGRPAPAWPASTSAASPAPSEGDALSPATTARIVGELDVRIGALVSAVVHHPEFCRLEALWRGLKLLVERTDGRAPIRLFVGACAKEKLADSMARFAQARGAARGDLVFVAAWEFDRSPSDLEVLASLARAGELLTAPTITAVAPAFLGARSVVDLERVANLDAMFDDPVYAEWRALRQREESRWLILAFNRFLARGRYGPDAVRTRSFEFDESVWRRDDDDDQPWANPVWLLAERLAARFARTGWAIELAGWRHGLVEALPVRTVRIGRSTTVQSPVASMFTPQQVEDLARVGVAAFTAQPNRDAALLLAVPSCHRPERPADAGETRLACRRATFSYQMFAARISSLAALVSANVAGGLPPQAVADAFWNAFGLMVPSADAFDILVAPAGSSSDRYVVDLTIRPERAGWPLPPVQLRCLVPR